jgi:hypothetical protein
MAATSSTQRGPSGSGNEAKRGRADDPKKPVVIPAKLPSDQKGELKRIGGSMSDDWNNRLVHDTVNTLWLKNSDDETKQRQIMAVIDGLIGIHPGDELEGMMAAQLIASHSATMECYRRAMIGEQTFEVRQAALNQANKLSRSFAWRMPPPFLTRYLGKPMRSSGGA